MSDDSAPDGSDPPDRGSAPSADPFLAGERAALRAPERDDLRFVRDAANDPRVRSALGLRYPSSRDEEERWFPEATERDDALALLVDAVGSVEEGLGREDAFVGGAREDPRPRPARTRAARPGRRRDRGMAGGESTTTVVRGPRPGDTPMWLADQAGV